MTMAISVRRRSLGRVFFAFLLIFFVRVLFFSTPSVPTLARQAKDVEIQEQGLFEGIGTNFDVQSHSWLQSRMGRDERQDIFSGVVRDGVDDYWERWQVPYMISKETSNMDAQHVRSAIDQLLSLNGWVAALCPTLARPFGQNSKTDTYEDLVFDGARERYYFIAIVIHSADHFLVDQLAVIVQMAKRLGTGNIFVSMLDYDSNDSTETLVDLCEAVLTLLGVPFRIRRVGGMTEDPAAAYYPLEEAYMRNSVLEPLWDLRDKRGVTFDRVVWLKGFTCPNDILETLRVSLVNQAGMVCGMDWAEHGGDFIFSDRWRTRDIEGDQFRQSKSSNRAEAGVPPRDEQGAQRYGKHLPFQVFCCEAGTHIVDPSQTYYKGIRYRSGSDFHNLSRTDPAPVRGPESPCLDSSQAYFCRDLWVRSAREGMEEGYLERGEGLLDKQRLHRRQGFGHKHKEAQAQPADPDANAGSDYDAMTDEDEDPGQWEGDKLAIPNSVFRPARILANPRCPTTYAGVSHTQLARDLFGDDQGKESGEGKSRYILEDWEGAPESFVCQEQRTTGGRGAPKTQRRLGFSIHDELQKL